MSRGNRSPTIYSFETEILSSLVDASLGLRVRPFVEGLLAVSHPTWRPTTYVIGRRQGYWSVISIWRAGLRSARCRDQRNSAFYLCSGLVKNENFKTRASVASLTNHDRKNYLSTAARVSVLEMIFSAFDKRRAKNFHFNKNEYRFWALDFDASMFNVYISINMSNTNRNTFICAKDMLEVPDTPFPTCEYFRYMAASLSLTFITGRSLMICTCASNSTTCLRSICNLGSQIMRLSV